MRGIGGDRGDGGEGADAQRAVRAPVHAGRCRRRRDIDQRSASRRRCGAARRDRCRRRGIRPACVMAAVSCGGPPFECGDQAVGPDRNFGQPDADGVADRVGDRRRGRHGRDLADADAAAEHVVEAALVEMHVDRAACRRCPGMR